MTIKTKLTQRDYINASFTTIIARSFIRYFLIIFILIVSINVSVGIAKNGVTLADVLPPVIIFVIYITFIYFSLKRAYSNNQRTGESIEYSFDPDNLVMKGESFKSELSWNKIYKVTKTKNWLLIWQTRQGANAIHKKDITDSELDKLKSILTNNQVKNNL